jgi:hypothetical protein
MNAAFTGKGRQMRRINTIGLASIIWFQHGMCLACDDPNDEITNSVATEVWKGGPVYNIVSLGVFPPGQHRCLDQGTNQLRAGEIPQSPSENIMLDYKAFVA